MSSVLNDMNKTRSKMIEFSKWILIVELFVLAVLIVCAINIPEVTWDTIICAWIAVIGASVAGYLWKSKTENRVKVPMKVIESLSEEVRDQIDLTQVITAIIQSE